jgi:oligoribonuclease NrnB/cAMP/cGMP phosphodiesterase (DHH superfamily)
MNSKLKTLIIYHGPHCNDGFTAAWITQRAMLEAGEIPELYPMGYGEEEAAELLSFLRQNFYRHIYVVDFSLKMDILAEMCTISTAQITILDHHKTAFQEYGYSMERFCATSSDICVFFNEQVVIQLDNSRSGAGICWDTFYLGKDMPWLVAYVQDRDIWKYALPYTKAMHMLISSREKCIAEWDILHAGLESPDGHEAAIALGDILLREYNNLVAQIVETAVPCTIHGNGGLMANCEGQYSSDVGHMLAELSGTYGLCYQETADGENIKCSLRGEADFDVERLAKKFGGGGHKAAAGFVVSVESIASKFFSETDRKELDFNE